MSVSLPIGPLQITYTWTDDNGTYITTGTIQINDAPADSPPGYNASVVRTMLSTVATPSSGGGASTFPQHLTFDPQLAVLTDGDIQCDWGGDTFHGNFTSNLQGKGTATTAGISSVRNWTAQLGETNVPLNIQGMPAGTITISGNQVTFNVTIANSPATATAVLDPVTGNISPGTGFKLGSYSSIVGTFTSNTSGSGSFLGVKKQGGSDATWDTSS